jgi:hypothetical protein
MGNHNVGRAMSAAAKGFWAGNGDAEVSKDKALAVLDAAAEDFIGADAEFDDELSEDTPLSRLVAIAFDATDDEKADLNGRYPCEDGDTGMLWYEGPYQKFRTRYKFC